MRRLIWYIRSCFCKHDWEQIFDSDIYWSGKSIKPYRCEKVYRCKKCGCEKRYTTGVKSEFYLKRGAE